MLSEGPGFELARVPIPRHLARFIDSWLGYRERSSRAVERVEHPSGRAVLIFEFGDAIEICDPDGASTRFRTGFFAGIDDRPTLTRFSGEQAGIEVNLSPEGAFALARGALRQLRALAVETTELGIDVSLGPRLREARSWEARFGLVAEALESRLQKARLLSPLVRRALTLIDQQHGALRMERISQALHVSRAHFHERFVAETGFSPKRYAALRRFSRVKDMLRAGHAGSLANIAAHVGYADHAHMSREVRKFSGTTPGDLARDLREPLAFEVKRLLSADGESFLVPA